jgi:hypothetical protein
VERNYKGVDTMKLQVGKKYKDREGNCVTIVSDKGYGEDHFIGIARDSDGYDIAYDFREDGSYFINEESQHDLIAEWTEPKPPQYAPYAADDLPMLRGRWYIDKNDGTQSMVVQFWTIDNVFYINGRNASEFLENCVWLDGTPCGKVVEE